MSAIGIDLSLVGTGLVVLEKGKVIEQLLIKSKPMGSQPADELIRIRRIVKQIAEVVDKNNPSVAVIENLAFMARNTSALTQLSGLNYFCRAVLADRGTPFYLCAPTSLKKYATGKGNVDKNQIMLAVYKNWKFNPIDDNVSDAFVLAKIGESLLNKEDDKLTAKQLEVVNLLSKQYENND